MSDDRGEIAIPVSVLGAWVTAAPAVLALSGAEIENGVIRVGALVAALTAIAVGVGLAWTRLRRLVLGVEKVVGADVRLTYLEECMEKVLDHLGVEPPEKKEGS